MGLRVWSINNGEQNVWVNVFILNVHKSGVSAKHRRALLCDTVSGCTKVVVLFGAIL